MALSDTVGELETNFASMTSTVTGVSTELASLHSEVVSLQAQVANAGAPADLIARIQAVADGLKVQSDALASAGTAAQDAPPATPPVTPPAS